MARLIVVGRDKLLKTFGFKTIAQVKFSKNDVKVIKEAIDIMEKAALLWYKAEGLDEDSIVDNPFAVAEIELNNALGEAIIS